MTRRVIQLMLQKGRINDHYLFIYRKTIIYTQGGLANKDRGCNMTGISCHHRKIAPRIQTFGI